MTHESPSSTPPQTADSHTLSIALAADESLGTVTVDAESLVALNIWMGQQLQVLENRFVDFQTPRTISRRRNSRG